MSSVIANLRVLLSADSALLRTQLGRANKDTQKWAQRQTQAINRVATAFVGLGATVASSLGAGDFVRRADEMILIEARLDALTGSSKKTAIAMGDINRMAEQSRAPFKATGELYTKMAIATEHLEVSQAKVAQTSQVVLDTFLLSGASASEAANSARQFAQGLASGRLQGDELRSVLENNVVLSKLLADGLGVTVGELRLLGEQGELTADKLLNVLGAAAADVRKDVEGMRFTFGQATVIMSNSYTNFVDKIEKKTHFVDALVDTTRWVSANFENLAWSAGVIGVAGVTALTLAVGNLILAMSPVALFATGVVVAMSGVAFFASKYSESIARGFFQAFHITIPTAYNTAILWGKEFQKSTILGWNKIVEKMAQFLNNMNVLGNSLPPFVKRLLGWDDGKGITLSGLKMSTDGLDSEIETIKARINELANLESAYQSMVVEMFTGSLASPDIADEAEQKVKSLMERISEMWSSTGEEIREDFNLIASSSETSWMQVLQSSSKNSQKLAAIYKGLAISQIIVDTARGIQSAWADPVLPFWGKVAASAKVAAIGAANLQTVRGQFHSGIDNVPNTGTYLLERGERVVDSRLNKDLTTALKSGGINSGGETRLAIELNGIEDPETVSRVLRENRGLLESMFREMFADRALDAPF